MELTKEIIINSKWRVTPEQSKRLQEKAFELGFVIDEDWNLEERYVHIGHTKAWTAYVLPTSDTERKFEDYFEPKNPFMSEEEYPKVKDSQSQQEKAEIPIERQPVANASTSEESVDMREKTATPVGNHIEIGASVKKSHKEGDVIVIDEAEFMSLSLVKEPINPNCVIEEIKFDKERSIYDTIQKPEGSFLWAMEQMKQGKKVRRSYYHKSVYDFLDKNTLKRKYMDGTNKVEFFVDDYEATDFEIYEEIKSSIDLKIDAIETELIRLISKHGSFCVKEAIKRAEELQ